MERAAPSTLLALALLSFEPLSAEGAGAAAPVVSLHAPGSSEVLIPAGSFLMGSTPDDVRYAIALCRKEPRGRGEDVCEKLFVNEMEAHEVTLSAFFIDRTEVTVGAYRRCVELGRCSAPPYASGATRFDRSDYPVTLVSWGDADEYCRFAGGRLPTEAEWERAARGAAGRRFPWGNVYNKSLANHGAFALDDTDDSDGFAELAPVGSFPLGRTPDGIDDMAGNVEEWVGDALDDASQYPKTSEVNPKGTGNGVFRLARGGAYGSYKGAPAGIGAGAPWLRGASRGFPHLASDRQTFRGFRCVHPLTDGL